MRAACSRHRRQEIRRASGAATVSNRRAGSKRSRILIAPSSSLPAPAPAERASPGATFPIGLRVRMSRVTSRARRRNRWAICSRSGTCHDDALADAEARQIIAADLDATLIGEAGRGYRKTTELVGRIVRILAEGRAKVGEIVAVTFTEKAAGELKLRLRERLDVERTKSLHDEERRQRLDRALTGLEEAHVGTIHAFCADLLRERPVEAGVDPVFEVLTEPAAARVFDEAFGRWLQEELANPKEGVRRALRRSSFMGDSDGPIDRLRGAAWDLAEWRDFTAPWTATRSIARRTSPRPLRRCTTSPHDQGSIVAQRSAVHEHRWSATPERGDQPAGDVWNRGQHGQHGTEKS